MPTEASNTISAIAQMKCPKCRKGNMFTNKSIFPLKKLLDMPERCTECGQKFELEVGFYYGTGYVSYALSVGLFFINLVWYWLIFGLSYYDNSMYYYLVTSTVIVLLLQPWLMRLSRVIYLNFFVKYKQGTVMKSEE